ncbi:MAG: proline dehydrogenase family protein [Candidatus Yanofskybacteria bacterium]|nr:proline dehydrogenase family protein [Candidatus Yanofskybacteria bacterium]
MKINIFTKAMLFLPRKIFIAGKTRQEALNVAVRLNVEGFLTTIDVLGEHSKNEDNVGKSLSEYKQLVDDIKKYGIQSTISIKLTHLGMELGFGYCFNVVKDLVSYASRNCVGVEFDMEEFKYNHDTIEIFQNLSKPEDKNRICLQANIKNSFENLDLLHGHGHSVRLVKGAYEEASDVSFYNQEDITENFKLLINLAFLGTIRNKLRSIMEPVHAIASRDKEIIDYARKCFESNHRILDKNCIEFQLLHGYLALGRQLLSEGFPVRIYLPYGEDSVALPYILRRLKIPHAWRLLFDWLLQL